MTHSINNMKPIPKSDLYTSNKTARLTLLAFEQVLGINGIKSLLHHSGQDWLIDNYPPDNGNKEFDFSELSMIYRSLEDIYGYKGAKGLSLRAGRAAFANGLPDYKKFAGVTEVAIRAIPVSLRVGVMVKAVARVYNKTSDQQSSTRDTANKIIYTSHVCPVCYGRNVNAPACYVTAGVIQEALKWITLGKMYTIIQTACIGAGDAACVYEIDKKPMDTG